ncbi:MAG: sigma-54-dependent Fis family transcriptional regulator [Magnetococcales bacterium]|nr:sigma-54-dependent Fis family transcriptional regulator [Magnetococcales bacterium]MBF0156038.1 sigma-54-dependent Fis family transcriptional regulator [Magnetococcales bacterium]
MVLVVDDDELIRDMVAVVMGRSGQETTPAGTLQEALGALRRQGFDLVIADLCLPDGSGLQVLAEVQKNHPRTYVIFVTGYPELDSVREALRQGAFDYLIKPIMPTELIHVVGRALEHKHFQEEREMLGNRLEAVFRGVDDAIIAMDERFSIIQVNAAAERLLGPGVPVVGQLLGERAGWLFNSVKSLLQQVQEQPEGKRAFCMVALNDNGRERILSCSASPFHDPKPNATGTILVVRDESQLTRLEPGLRSRQGWHGLVGASRPMREVYELIELLAEVDSTALITGETGTGKELVVRALHEASPRRERPFVAVNCAALPPGLLESELFGHAKGAFTNAVRDKAGRFKLADGGTIFLDEIGDLSMEMQVRLLRVLQEQSFEALGDNRPIRVDVRVVAATHRNLLERVREGLFREDLYYRLKVVEVRIPPLRERKADLPLLIDHFLARFNARLKRSVKGVSEEVLEVFMEHHWPGNVRELEHVLEHAVVVARQPILVWSNLPPELRARTASPLEARPPASGQRGRPLKGGLAVGEWPDRESILQALEESRWQVGVAADRLGVSRSTLWRRMKTLGVRREETTGRE